MDVRFPRYAPVVLTVFAVLATACDDNATSATSPEPVVATQSIVTAEPAVVAPEFLPAGSCVARSPFGLRLRVDVTSSRDLVIRGIRFRLTDSFGTSALPEVIPLPSGDEAALPSPQSSPPPGASILPASPIPIPGASPLAGVQISGGTRRGLPFFLRFGCGVFPEGTLFIATHIASGNGHVETPEVRVRVRR